MNHKIKKFIDTVNEEAKNIDIKVSLVKNETLKIDGVEVHGYFDEETCVLKCAIKKPLLKWLTILVHEYCHMQQYIDNPSVWRTYNQESEDVFFSWLSGKRRHKKTLRRFVKRCVALELDCEKRSVQIIKKFDLPIDISTYIRKANSYLYIYSYALERRKWYKKTPYDNPAVYNKFNKTFAKNYMVLPDKYKDLYDRYCL